MCDLVIKMAFKKQSIQNTSYIWFIFYYMANIVCIFRCRIKLEITQAHSGWKGLDVTFKCHINVFIVFSFYLKAFFYISKYIPYSYLICSKCYLASLLMNILGCLCLHSDKCVVFIGYYDLDCFIKWEKSRGKLETILNIILHKI